MGPLTRSSSPGAWRALRASLKGLPVVFTLLPLLSSSPLEAQEPTPPDTVRADTLIEVLPDSVREVFAEPDSAGAAAFPSRLLPLRGDAYAVYECDHACLQASTAFSLLELLQETVPGITTVRAGFFAGPHFALYGPYGAGFVRLFIDGREVPSLDASSTDLRRASLVYLERVRVTRDADGLIVDVETRRQAGGEAYSRISGGTGQPNAQVLDGIFTNGLGRNFTVEGAFELQDVGAGGVENDRFDVLARLNWMPRGDRVGLQLEYRSESVDRTAADTADIARRQLLLRGRFDISRDLQLEAYYATAGLRASDSTLRETKTVGVEVSASRGDGTLALGLSSTAGNAYPSLDARLTGGYAIGDGLTIETGAGLQSWDGFTTSQLRAALAYSPPGLPIVLRADGSTGTRGIPLPIQERADSVSFRALGASAEVKLGPYRLSGRYGIQNLSRQLSFGAGFDSLLVASEELDVKSWEIGVRGPLIPIGALIPGLEPIRLTGNWRRQDAGAVDALFLPADLARGGLLLRDDFFAGNLEIWLGAFMEYRSATRSVRAGATEPVLLSSYTWTGGHFMFRIRDFRFFWRLTNPTGVIVADVPGAEFPRQVNVFGVRWEFFN